MFGRLEPPAADSRTIPPPAFSRLMLSFRPARRVAPLLLPILLSVCGGDDGPTKDSSPAVIQMVSGDDQWATVGSSLPNPFVVEVLDSDGRPVGGRTVSWSVVEGSGTLSAPTSVTNAQGEARSFLRVGSVAGAQRVRASLSSLTPVTFLATAMPRAAAQVIAVSGSGQSAIAGSMLEQPLVVRVVDATGAVVPGATVSFAVTSGGGSVQSPTVVSDASGQASTTWRLGAAAGTQSVSADVAGATWHDVDTIDDLKAAESILAAAPEPA